jgi:hypothetical protein
MTKFTENDVIDAGGGVGARSSMLAAAAADTGPEGGGAQWLILTKGKVKVGGAEGGGGWRKLARTRTRTA